MMRWFLRLGLIVALLAPLPAWGGVGYINGLETGDASELLTLGAGATIQSTITRSGNYALKAPAISSTYTQSLSSTQTVLREYVYFGGAFATGIISRERSSTPANRLQLGLGTGPSFQVTDAAATLGLSTTTGTVILKAGQWYRVEIVEDLAAGGVVEVLVNGVLDINTTHTNDVSATPTVGFTCVGQASPNEIYFDDARIDTGTLTPPGAGQIIARQGIAGTPTYDTWTKNGGATAAAVWSNTPFTTDTNATSSTSGAAQTMNIAPFSLVQSGHGTQVVGPNDTVNATKVGLVFKRATSGSPKIRRRVAGVDTDTTVTGATTDAYQQGVLTAVTPANLDTMEAGMVKAADTNLTTVEDVWVIIDYTPAAVPNSLSLLGVGR